MAKDARIAIASLMVVAFTIGTDFTGALLLVTAIERDFSTDITTTQWVLNIYALTFGIFMVTGGRLGDMYGHRRQILVGVGIFLIASIGCLAAPSFAWLVGSRAIQGIGAALLWPCVLALATAGVDETKRGLAIGLILAGITGGNVTGPLIAGVATSLGDWRLFFLVNAVMALLSLAMALRFLKREAPGKSDERIDLAGMALLGLALFGILYGLDVGADWGWTAPGLIGLFALSGLLFVAFLLVQFRVKDPMVPPSLMRNRQFLLTLSTNGLLIPPLFVAFLYFPQFMQKTMGWSVLTASIGMLPLMVLLSVGSILSGRLYEPIGPKRLLLAGYALVVLGATTIVFVTPSWGYFAILPAMILMGLGATLSIGTAGTAAVSSVTPSRAGVAGGLSFLVHLALGAIGVAGATAIMNAETAGANGAGLDTAFATGLSHAYWLATAVAVVGIAVVLAIDEKKLRAPQD